MCFLLDIVSFTLACDAFNFNPILVAVAMATEKLDSNSHSCDFFETVYVTEVLA